MSLSIEKQIEEKQRAIRNLTEMRPSAPLPSVLMIPNLARGSNEMWQIYQYELSEYQRLQSSEQDPSKQITGQHKPLNQPVLSQPLTRIKPLSYPEKVERAKLIAKHLTQGVVEYDPMKNIELVKELQVELMDLEEQYLNGQ